MAKYLCDYFSTGEFAKICGVNKRTLFHYDDIGLFQPAITDEKGYRYYSSEQFDIFLIISMLKELSVPLHEMKQYLDERTPEKLQELSRQKIVEIDQKIAKLHQIRHLLTESIQVTEKGIHVDDQQIFLEEQEEEYLILSDLLYEISTKDSIQWMHEFKRFEDQVTSESTSFVGTMLSREDILNRNYFHNIYFFARTTKRSDATFIKPKALYLIAFHRGSYKTIGDTYERIKGYCIQNSFQIGDFSFEDSLFDNVSQKEEDGYLMQISIAVEKIK